MIPQPFEVDVVHEGASLLGPILIALGAVIAAGLTAGLTVFTANRRHRTQLEQDRFLQEAQLEHDRALRQEHLEHDQERLRVQLQHDREMRHRENVQRFLDDAIDRERELRHSVSRYAREVREAEEERVTDEGSGVADPVDPDVREELDRRHVALLRGISELTELHGDVLSDGVLLRVRMGNHDIVEKHSAVTDAIGEMLDAVSVRVQDEWEIRSKEEKDAVEAAEEAVAQAQSMFLLACVEWHDPSRA